MAKKTKNPSRSLHEHAAIQEAITKVQLTEVERLQPQIATSLGLAEAAVAGLRTIEESVSRVASSLRHLLKAQEHGPASPQGSDRPKPARRKMVASTLSMVSSIRSRERKGQPRKRLSRKQAGKEFFHEHELPH